MDLMPYGLAWHTIGGGRKKRKYVGEKVDEAGTPSMEWANGGAKCGQYSQLQSMDSSSPCASSEHCESGEKWGLNAGYGECDWLMILDKWGRSLYKVYIQHGVAPEALIGRSPQLYRVSF